MDAYLLQPRLSKVFKRLTKINADENAIVEAAMADLDAEYEALVADYALTSV